ncbi:MAG: hypothetical protein A2X61_16970 [Ignavibacteria bacterium GWB2_35_12]|nr:MAG: hypothetical protein A2X63_01920 [Ignavibacteria bacterium GWA2_35_8]OGU38043.1 MAG: hypothetical protein A2X61_16970 [Ignavibacteria bacterium GWB2_35_12]OGU87489.1 MAG: hypothetical protein A2220_17055 [Ignavibacteria bacterium RIFOXYA2_FULL_35_10]OGV25035.1 MAG: hypothetical protein A2475_16655 [Ignavibacteria bacterium RIFOXYC2_FULL_35_21]
MGNTTEIKSQVKEAMAEFFTENRTILRDAVIDAIEDIGLEKAIAEGDKNDYVSEEEILSTLNSI